MLSQRTLIISIGAAALVGVLTVLIVVFWDYELEETKRVMLTTSHNCPTGTVESVERGGEIGWFRTCKKNGIRDGPFVYWKKQRKYAEGTYRDDQQVGQVQYFDEEGRVVRVEERSK